MTYTVEQLQRKLNNLLPNKYIIVWEGKNPLGDDRYIACDIARDAYEINGVRRQYRDHISFEIENDKLKFFPFGGSGGNYIYRKVDKTIEGEKYLALGKEKLKTKNFKDLDKYIEYIAEEYKKIIHNINARNLAC